MDFDYDFDKIKKAPWFVAKHAFWATLIAIGVAVVLGLVLGYKYVYLVKQIEPEPPELTHLNQEKLQDVLDELDQREVKFEKITPPPYNLFKSD